MQRTTQGLPRFARVLLAAAVGSSLVLFSSVRAERAHSACEPTAGAHLRVALAEHVLSVCDGAQVLATYDVRLGSGGSGKSREGDHKTPVGAYPLGVTRRSSRCGIFVPIGYPTPEQRERGVTGSDVGVHGPHRGVRWLGSWVNAFDTTDGCVGIATDEEMTQLADWIQKRSVKQILLR